MYVRLFKWEFWLELLDNRQYWQEYDSCLKLYQMRFWRLYVIINRSPL